MENQVPTKKNVVPVETKQALAGFVPKTEISVFDTVRMDAIFVLAKKISASSLIPEHYQNNPSNCFLAMWKAERMGMDFHSFMQVSYVLKGKFGYEAKFVIARLNTSGKFKGPIRWKADGEVKLDKRETTVRVRDKNSRDPNAIKEIKKESFFVSIDSTRSWTAYATIKGSEEQIEQTFFLKTAILNGWTEDPTSKWNTMTEEKGQYQSAVFLGRMYAPEVIMDMQTKEELEDIKDAEFIDAREIGRDIFEKGEPVDTTPAPVLDPAKEVKQGIADKQVEPVITLPESSQDSAPIAPVKTPVVHPEPVIVPPADLSKEPPVDLAEFRAWMDMVFASESHDLDVFLLGKKWLAMGETYKNLTDTKLKNLRGQWEKFKNAYETFRKSRKGGAA